MLKLDRPIFWKTQRGIINSKTEWVARTYYVRLIFDSSTVVNIKRERIDRMVLNSVERFLQHEGHSILLYKVGVSLILSKKIWFVLKLFTVSKMPFSFYVSSVHATISPVKFVCLRINLSLLKNYLLSLLWIFLPSNSSVSTEACYRRNSIEIFLYRDIKQRNPFFTLFIPNRHVNV